MKLLISFLFITSVYGRFSRRVDLDKIQCSKTGRNTRQVIEELEAHNYKIAVSEMRKIRLGEGSEGIVYKVFYRNCVFALKCPIESDLDLHPEFELMKVLAMENVVQVFGIYDRCMAMELYDSDLVGIYYDPRKPFTTPLRTVLHYAHNVLNALEHLHARGYIYSDLKPDNILISKSKHKAALGDFGMVVKEGSSIEGTTLDFSPLAIPGLQEAYRAHDIYSFGQVLKHLFGIRINPRVFRRDLDATAKSLFAFDFKKLNPFLYEEHSITPVIRHPNAPIELILACLDLSPSKRPLIPEIRHQLHKFEAGQRPKTTHKIPKMKTWCPELRKNLAKIQISSALVEGLSYPVLELARVKAKKAMGKFQESKKAGFAAEILNCRVYIEFSSHGISHFPVQEKLLLPLREGQKTQKMHLIGISHGKLDAVVPKKLNFIIYQAIVDGATKNWFQSLWVRFLNSLNWVFQKISQAVKYSSTTIQSYISSFTGLRISPRA